MDIGNAIKQVRKKRKMSQQRLAKKLKVTQGFLSFLEKNKREPTVAMLERLSKELKVPKELILLLACSDSSKEKKFSKPLKRIARALDDMLIALEEDEQHKEN